MSTKRNVTTFALALMLILTSACGAAATHKPTAGPCHSRACLAVRRGTASPGWPVLLREPTHGSSSAGSDDVFRSLGSGETASFKFAKSQ